MRRNVMPLRNQTLERSRYRRLLRKAMMKVPIPSENQAAIDQLGNMAGGNPFNGHCYNATHAALILFGWKQHFVPVRNYVPKRLGHFWLWHPTKNIHFDATGFIRASSRLQKGRDFRRVACPRLNSRPNKEVRDILNIVCSS